MILLISYIKKLQIQLPFWTKAWERMVPNLGTSYVRLGSSPFTTMASTLNFFVISHYDETDSGLGIIAWFDKYFNPSTCRRSLFRLIDYGLFIRPKQRTLMIFKPTKVKHQTFKHLETKDMINLV